MFSFFGIWIPLQNRHIQVMVELRICMPEHSVIGGTDVNISMEEPIVLKREKQNRMNTSWRKMKIDPFSHRFLQTKVWLASTWEISYTINLLKLWFHPISKITLFLSFHIPILHTLHTKSLIINVHCRNLWPQSYTSGLYLPQFIIQI